MIEGKLSADWRSDEMMGGDIPALQKGVKEAKMMAITAQGDDFIKVNCEYYGSGTEEIPLDFCNYYFDFCSHYPEFKKIPEDYLDI